MTFRESRQGFINECGYLVVHNSDSHGKKGKVRILKAGGYLIWTIPLLANRIRMRITSMMMLRARWETVAGAASTRTSRTTTATSRTMNSIDIIKSLDCKVRKL